MALEDKKLSFASKIGYGIGDYSGNLIYSAISSFLIVYYVSVAHVDAALAASVIAVSKIFDGISDLIMGYIIEHTNSKFGKARPWIMRLCVPLAICTVFMFSVPIGLEEKVKTAYIFLTYNLVSTIFYTGINVPYAALNGLMTTDSYERGLLGNFRMLFATAGTMTVNTVVLKMTAFFGDGDAYSQKGWTVTFIILMAAFVILNMITFFTCKETVTISKPKDKSSVPLVSHIKGLVTNKYWLIMVICMFAMYFMMSCFFASALFYAKYNLLAEDKFSIISNALSVAQIATMFVTPFIMKLIGKRRLFMLGILISAIGFVLTGIAGDNVTLVIILSAVKGIGFGCAAATMFGLLQDALTYGTWKNGFDSMGIGNAASSFCTKVGSGLGTAALGKVLQLGHFEETAVTQQAEALTAVSFAFVSIPAITMAVAFVCMLFFDLTENKYKKIVGEM